MDFIQNVIAASCFTAAGWVIYACGKSTLADHRKNQKEANRLYRELLELRMEALNEDQQVRLVGFDRRDSDRPWS